MSQDCMEGKREPTENEIRQALAASGAVGHSRWLRISHQRRERAGHLYYLSGAWRRVVRARYEQRAQG